MYPEVEHKARLRELHDLMNIWPIGMICWHKATGERMIVNGYKVHATGVWVTVSGRSDCNVDAFELSAKPVPEDGGEEWQRS